MSILVRGRLPIIPLSNDKKELAVPGELVIDKTVKDLMIIDSNNEEQSLIRESIEDAISNISSIKVYDTTIELIGDIGKIIQIPINSISIPSGEKLILNETLISDSGYNGVGSGGSIGKVLSYTDTTESIVNVKILIVSYREPENGSGIPVGPITDLVVTSGTKQLILTWTDPEDIIIDLAPPVAGLNNIPLATWSGTMIRRKTEPWLEGETPKSGDLIVYNKERNKYKNNGYIDSNLISGTEYYYQPFTYNDSNKWNTTNTITKSILYMDWTWTFVDSPTGYVSLSVCYGNGLFVALATSMNNFRIMTSPDGINWTLRTNPNNNYWTSVCYGNGLFVAVASTGSGNRVMTSPDGINWTIRSSAANNDWQSVCYGNGLFVAVSSTGSNNRVMTSEDGITWTIRTGTSNNELVSVCYGNGLFVAVGPNANGNGSRVVTSENGIVWVNRTIPGNCYFQSICYGNGLFVTVAGYSDIIGTSEDGINWNITTGPINYLQSVCYGDGLFVIVGRSNFDDVILISEDGIEWAIRSSTSGKGSLYSVCYGNGLFVAVGDKIIAILPYKKL